MLIKSALTQYLVKTWQFLGVSIILRSMLDINLVYVDSFVDLQDSEMASSSNKIYENLMHLISIESTLQSKPLILIYGIIISLLFAVLMTTLTIHLLLFKGSRLDIKIMSFLKKYQLQQATVSSTIYMLRLSIILLCDLLQCHDIQVSQEVKQSKNIYGNLSKNDITEQKRVFTDVVIQTSMLSDYITCYDSHYFALAGILGIILSLCFIISIIASKISLILLDESIDIDIHSTIFELSLISMTIFHHFFITQMFDFQWQIYYSLILLIFFLLYYWQVHFTGRILSLKRKERLKLRVLILFSIQGSFLISKASYRIFHTTNRFFFLVIVILILPFLVKLHKNMKIQYIDFEEILQKLEKQEFSGNDLLRVLSSLKFYIETVTSSINYKNLLIDKNHLFWLKMHNTHIKKCSDIYCKCKSIQSLDPEKIQETAVVFINSEFQKLIKSEPGKQIYIRKYLNFLLDIKGDYAKAISIVERQHSTKAFRLSKLDRYLFKVKIIKYVQIYSKFRTFQRIFDKRVHVKNTPPANNFLVQVSNILQMKARAEEIAFKLINLKKSTLENSLENPMIGKIYRNGIQFLKYKKKLLSILNNIESRSLQSYSYVYMMKMLYYSYIENQPRIVREMIRVVKSKAVHVHLGYLLKGRDYKNNMMIVVGNESKNYHRIISCSGEVSQIVGWTTKELQGSDLKLLLPKGLQEVHSRIMRSGTYFEGRLESEFEIKSYSVDNRKRIKRTDVFIKLEYLEKIGTVFMCALSAEDANFIDNKRIIMVDQRGLILHASQEGEELVTRGQNIGFYNKPLQVVIQLLSIFYDNFAKNGYFPNFSTSEIIKNPLDAMLWELFILWQNEQLLTFMDKSGRRIKTNVKIEVHKFGQGENFGFNWIITLKKVIKDEYTCKREPMNMRMSDQNSGVINQLSEIFDYCKERYNPPSMFQTKTFNQKIDCYVIDTEEIQKDEEISEEFNLDDRLVKLILDDYKSSIIVKDTNSKASLIKILTQNNSIIQNNHTSIGKRVFKSSISTGEQRERLANNFGIQKMRDKLLGIKRQRQNRYNSSHRGTYLSKIPYFSEIDKYDKEKRRIDGYQTKMKHHMSRMGLMIIASLITLCTIMMTLVLESLKYRSYVDIGAEAGNLHYFVDLQKSSIGSAIGLDICHMIKDDPSLTKKMIEFGEADISETCIHQIEEAVYGIVHIQETYRAFERLEFHHLLSRTSLESHKGSELKTYYPAETPEGSETQNYSKEVTLVNMRVASTWISGYTSYIVKHLKVIFDFETSTSSTNQKNNLPNTNFTLIEDNLRFNLIRGYSKEILDIQGIFQDYLVRVSGLNVFHIFIHFVWISMNCLAFLAFSSIVSCLEIRSSMRLYKAILQFKVLIYYFFFQYFQEETAVAAINKSKVLSKNLRLVFSENINDENYLLNLNETPKQKETQFNNKGEMVIAQTPLASNNELVTYKGTKMQSSSTKGSSQHSREANKQINKRLLNKKIRKSKSFFGSNRVKGSFMFGYDWYIIKSFAILSIFVILHGLIYYLNRYQALKVQNSLTVMNLSNSLWSTHSTISLAMLEILIFNNTHNVLNQSSLETFEYMVDEYTTQISPQVMESLSYDLGNFTSLYRQYMVKENSCGTIILRNQPELCKQMYAGVLKQGLIKSSNEIVVLASDLINKWKIARENEEEVKIIMNHNTLLSQIAKGHQINDERYLFISENSMSVLMSTIENENTQTQTIQQYIDILEVVVIIYFVGSVVYRSLLQLLDQKMAIFYLFGLPSLSKNKLLINKMLRQSKDQHLLVIFIQSENSDDNWNRILFSIFFSNFIHLFSIQEIRDKNDNEQIFSDF